MKRNVINFLIDLISAAVMAAMLATGLLIRFVLPPGGGSRRVLWGYGRHDWGDLHFWLAVTATGILVLHVALHWQWVCAMVGRLLPGGRKQPAGALRRHVGGIVAIAVMASLFTGFVGLAQRSVRASASAASDRGGGAQTGQHVGVTEGRAIAARDDGGPFIQGSMTLTEVAEKCGLSEQTVRSRLELAADEPADERLGRLSKKYGFAMQDAREKLNGNWRQP